jgi:large conductance mechanosensitive channel
LKTWEEVAVKKIFSEFREFALRGSVVDLAVGIVIGAAFTGVVNSLVNDILMPPIGMLLGKVDFSDLFISLDGQTYASLANAQEAGAATFNYGSFISSIINFLIVAFAIFVIIKQINRFSRQSNSEKQEPQTKVCPYCKSKIAVNAIRCPFCTSELI